MRAKSFGLILFSLSSSMIWGTTATWTGNSSADWSVGNNWNPPNAPTNGQDLVFPSGLSTTSTINDLASLSVNTITLHVDGPTNYALNGNAITLQGSPPQITVPAAVGTPGTVTINTPLVLGGNFTASNANGSPGFTINGAITDIGQGFSLTYDGNQTLSLTSNGNNYSGGTILVNASVISGTTTSIPSSGGIQFQSANSSLILSAGTSGTYSGAITTNAGGGAILINGGVVTLSNTSNNYAQGTTIATATLSVGNDAVLGLAGTSVNLGLAAGDLPVFQASSSFTTSRPITLTANSSRIDPNGNTFTLSGLISGTGGLVVGGHNGTVSLTNNTNSYVQGTTITTGTLTVTGDGALGQAGTTVTLGSVAGDLPVFQAPSSQTLNIGRPFVLTAITSRIDPNGGDINHTSTATGSGGLHVGLNAGGSLLVNGLYSYTGGTTVDSGTIQLFGSGSLPHPGVAPAGDVTLNLTGSLALDLSNGPNTTSIGNLFGSGNIKLGANNLSVTITIASPYAGVISGTGSLIKNGSITMDLAGGNTYTGGTTINDGVLAIEEGGKIGPGPMTINSPGQFIISPAAYPQQIGTLSGNGSITLGNNTLTHVPTGNTTFTGTILGNSTSVFEQNALPSLTLSGISPNMTGELLITQGTVIGGAANILPSLRLLSISSGATFSLTDGTNQFDQSMGDLNGGGTLNLGGKTFTNNSKSDQIFSGVIQGNGSSKFVHSGAFTLTLEGVSTLTGAVEVANGILFVDTPASITGATTTVDAAGRLKGFGTVGTLNNFGVVQPGGSIGTLHVTGPYTESGTLEIEVNDKGQSSLLDVNGAITINPGTTLHIKPKHGTYNSSLVYTVETNTGARTGTYTTVKTSLSNRFHVTAIYDPNDIKIALGVTPFPIIIHGGNAGAVAACFETIPGGNGTDHEFVMNALEDLSDDLVALRQAFNQLQPSQLNALPLVQQNNDILVRSALSQRFSYRRTIDLPYPRPAPVTDEATESAESTPAPQVADKMPTTRKGTVWVEGLGKYAHQDNKQDNPGYKAATGGGLIGADYRFFSRAYFGAALGYTSTNLHISEASGHAHIHSGYGAVYGNVFSKRVFLDASAIASYNHYHVSRHIHFTGINRHARNSHNGYQLGGSLGMGFFINTHNLQIQPYDRADFIFTHQNKFREHGAQSINLRVKHKDSRYVRNDLGVKVLRCWEFSSASFIPYIKASWIWEQQLDKGHLSASFTESPCQFIVIGMHPIRSLFAPSVGFTTLAFKEAFSFSFHFDAEIGSKFWENRAYFNFAYRY